MGYADTEAVFWDIIEPVESEFIGLEQAVVRQHIFFSSTQLDQGEYDTELLQIIAKTGHDLAAHPIILDEAAMHPGVRHIARLILKQKAVPEGLVRETKNCLHHQYELTGIELQDVISICIQQIKV